MLRSLVGSEMCIRDSYKVGPCDILIPILEDGFDQTRLIDSRLDGFYDYQGDHIPVPVKFFVREEDGYDVDRLQGALNERDDVIRATVEDYVSSAVRDAHNALKGMFEGDDEREPDSERILRIEGIISEGKEWYSTLNPHYAVHENKTAADSFGLLDHWEDQSERQLLEAERLEQEINNIFNANP